jgi:polygalacturonase
MIYLERTVGAKLEGVTIFNHVGWTIILRATNDTHVDGIRILNATDTCGTDGIDIVAGSGVLVENAFVRTNDDCVAVKSLSEKDGEVHDITVRHSVIWDRFCGNALEIGFELRAPKIERIRFEDIDVIRVEDHGSPISIHNGDSGTVQDVTYKNIRVEEAQHKLMDFSVVHGRYGVDRPVPDLRLVDLGEAWRGVLRETAAEKAASAQARGHIRNIRVANLQVVDGKLPFSIISGYDKEHSVDNVRIEGLKYLGRPIRNAGEGKFSIENARGFEIRP